MTTGQQIEKIRIAQQIKRYDICNMMCLTDEGYNDIVLRGREPTIFEWVLLICNVPNPYPFIDLV